MTTASRAWRGGRADWKLHALSGFSLAVAFVCLASALLVVFNLDAVRQRWARAGRASIYLRDGVTPQMVSELRSALTQTPGVTSVRHVSQEDARQEVISSSTDAAIVALPAEAFPASIEIEMASSVSDVDLAGMTTHLNQIPAVESVETYDRYTQKLQGLMQAGMVASLVLALVVLAAVVSVVGSTVRLALQRRRIEVDVLRLVGASDAYVRRPFVLEGCALGAAGAGAAIVLLGVMYLIVREQVADVATLMLGVSPTFLPWYASVGLVGLGALLGAASSHFSLRRMVTV
ncbi:MAG: ABC transporter permease [Sorangium cellulosum]|nr:MAG: ABC transporter permease [Sorangium cellulosum]